MKMENNPTLCLGSTDIQIIKLLQKYARSINKELAAQLGLIIKPVYERVKRIEKSGVIRKYIALIEANKTGKNIVSLCMLRLEKHTKDKLAQFEAQVANIPEVTECYHLAGQYDYPLKILVKDMNAFQDLIVNKLSTNENLTNVQSSFVMKKITDTTKYL